MRKKILFVIAVLIFGLNRANALTYGGCDSSVLSKYKSLVTNINITYDYHISDNQAYFDVTLTNIVPNMYFIDIYNNKTYTYNDTNNGEITIRNYTNASGSYKFYLQTSGCDGNSLGTKYYKFPTYNVYYNDPMCSDIPNYSLCQKWTNVNYSYDKFESSILEYKASLEEQPLEEEIIEYNKSTLDIIVDLYVKYYYYFLIAIILVCCSIMVISRRKNKFKL